MIYAKAEARAAAIEPAAAPVLVPPLADEEAVEARLRAWAVPIALLLSWLLVKTGPGHTIVRIFCSMWVHELGHASAAWLSGYPAFPGPWLTLTAESRSVLLAALVFAGLAYLAVRCWVLERRVAAAAASVAILAQLFCTAGLRPDSARVFIVFMGDGGCLVLGSLLMATFYAPEGSVFRRGALRWGFLGIGAASFSDAFEQWCSARTDPDRIPFGANEGVGPSDPSVLFDTFHWSATNLVHRYVALGIVCLAALACLHVVMVRRAAAAVRAAS
ncbi:MAG TPA: hypothetical protein VG496_03170 [Myxococcales bacterium]|nr:hypothetical protein [Myxococcales bacterium]